MFKWKNYETWQAAMFINYYHYNCLEEDEELQILIKLGTLDAERFKDWVLESILSSFGHCTFEDVIEKPYFEVYMKQDIIDWQALLDAFLRS